MMPRPSPPTQCAADATTLRQCGFEYSVNRRIFSSPGAYTAMSDGREVTR